LLPLLLSLLYVLLTIGNVVMDIVYTTHILLIHFITTITFDIESLYHSTYLFNISFKYHILHLKTQNSFIFTLLYYYIFCYIRVKVNTLKLVE